MFNFLEKLSDLFLERDVNIDKRRYFFAQNERTKEVSVELSKDAAIKKLKDLEVGDQVVIKSIKDSSIESARDNFDSADYLTKIAIIANHEK